MVSPEEKVKELSAAKRIALSWSRLLARRVCRGAFAPCLVDSRYD